MQMDPGIISLTVSLLFLSFLTCFAVYVSFLIYSSFKGSPYVPTKKKFLHKILAAARLKKGMAMLELGCGDGRMLIEAVRTYGVTGYGVDINSLVLLQARWNARNLPTTQISFKTRNIRDIEVGQYDVVYLFLLPKILATFAPHWEKQAKKRSLFISHAFSIRGWEKFLEKKIPGEPYDTYFYRLK